MADLFLNIVGTDGASAALRAVGLSFSELAKLAADCTKQFEEQAKADRQLEKYAGDLTGAFKAQATAMQETLGVSDDMVEQMQTMLLRFGEAPESVEATTRALLDYSAATGTDAVAATKTLLTSVNSGKAAFKDLGLEYEQTGFKSKDLELVTKALADKVGGSAKAEAGSLSGQVAIATEAVGEFKEAIGGLLSEFATRTGAVTTFTQAVRDLQVLLFGAAEDSTTNIQKNLDAAKEKLKSMQSGWSDVLTLASGGAFGPSGTDIEDQIKEVARLEAAWKAADQAKRTANRQAEELTDLTGDSRTNKGKKEAEKAANERKLSDFESFSEAMTRAEFKRAEDQKEALAELERNRTEAQIADQKQNAEDLRAEDEHFEKKRRQLDNELQYRLDMAEKAEKEEAKIQKKLRDQMVAEAKRTQKEVAEAATAIGLAFANALASALAEALEGGEVDAIGLAVDIGFSVAAIAASTIANIYSPGSGALIGGVIGAVGTVARAARSRAWKEEQASKKKYHEGGWAGAEKFHGGGWPSPSTDEQAAILQNGERVLSRAEVARMGGPRGVDSAARGRGAGLHVTVVAQDSQGVREFFEDRGGRGIYNAIRTGRGALTQTALGR